MFAHRITLLHLFGFTVKVDASWLFLATLIVWSLAAGYFPVEYPDLPSALYWWMGVAGAIGLLFSIVFHELSHAFVARRYGVPIRGITLFVFGGVAEMQEEPARARDEFLMALAGPIASLVLAGCFYAALALASSLDLGAAAQGVLSWLAMLNLVLAGFNLIPAFPLDGGRMLRAALWRWRQDLEWATRMAARSGEIFGFLLMGLALVSLLTGSIVGAIWYFLIGLFVRSAAGTAYVQTMTREIFRGETVRRIMTPGVVAVPPHLTVRQFVEEYIYRHRFRSFPVVVGDRLVGRVSIDHVGKAPAEEWDSVSVADIMEGCSDKDLATPDEPVLEAIRKMRENGRAKLIVVEGKRPVGVLTLRDLFGFLSLKLALEKHGGALPRDLLADRQDRLAG